MNGMLYSIPRHEKHGKATSQAGGVSQQYDRFRRFPGRKTTSAPIAPDYPLETDDERLDRVPSGEVLFDMEEQNVARGEVPDGIYREEREAQLVGAELT